MEKESNFLNDDILPAVRTSFLTVLCVLTFIGSAYGLYQGVTSITNSKKMASMVTSQNTPEKQEEQRKKLEEKNDKGSKFALKMMDGVKDMADENKIKQSGIIAIIANLLTLAGAVLMWRLNRTGFYLYVAGIVAWVASPFIIYGTGSFIAMIGAAFGFFIGLLFIILYAMNLKDMRASTTT